MRPEFLSDGIFISIVGITVVFSSLILLLFVFSLLPKILQLPKNKKLQKEGKVVETSDLSGEMNAAIATAIYLYFNEIHDEESHEMTIKKIMKTYSPWSSKIYSMNTLKK